MSDPTDHLDDGHDPTVPEHDPACAVAHGGAPDDQQGDRVLVAVFATPLASYLLRWGAELGFATYLLAPEGGMAADGLGIGERTTVVSHVADLPVDASTDVVVTDHHRDDLGAVMAPLVAPKPRWIGIIGSPRHEPVHVQALRDEGVDDTLIETVRRPIGVDIGSKTPPEIALSVLAGLLADRNGRDGGLPDRPSIGASA